MHNTKSYYNTGKNNWVLGIKLQSVTKQVHSVLISSTVSSHIIFQWYTAVWLIN